MVGGFEAGRNGYRVNRLKPDWWYGLLRVRYDVDMQEAVAHLRQQIEQTLLSKNAAEAL